MNDCEKWLFEELNDVREKAKEKGFKKDQLKEARKAIGVKTYHQYDEFGDTKNWFWELP